MRPAHSRGRRVSRKLLEEGPGSRPLTVSVAAALGVLVAIVIVIAIGLHSASRPGAPTGPGYQASTLPTLPLAVAMVPPPGSADQNAATTVVTVETSGVRLASVEVVAPLFGSKVPGVFNRVA